MSDSFADLWSASVPSKPKDQPLSAALSSSSAPSKSLAFSKTDAFTLLSQSGSASGSRTSTPRYGTTLAGAAAGSPYLTSRPITPSFSNPSIVSSTTNTTGSHIVLQPQPQPISKRNGNTDSFGDLFSSSSSIPVSGNMTLAARLAIEAQRKGTAHPEQGSGVTIPDTNVAGGSSAWAGIDALAGGFTPTPLLRKGSDGQDAKARAVVVDDVDDWGLADFRSEAAIGAASRTGGSVNAPGAARPKPQTAGSLWDLADFTSSTTPASASALHTTSTNVRSRSDSIGGRHGDAAAQGEQVTSPDEEFDFGGREDRVDEARREQGTKAHKLLDLFEDDHDVTGGPESARRLLHSTGDGHDEDDILGLLSKPVETLRNHHSSSPEPPRRHLPPATSTPKPSSPPPHVLGQIVEMGFSVQQARAALAQTQTGLDVPAAIESLLNNSAPTAPNPVLNAVRASPRTDGTPPRATGAPKGQRQRERERLERQRAASASPSELATATPPSVADIQEQADKLLAQASEIGLSVFSKATAMWGKGKERVVKAYEERASTASPFGDGTSSKGSGLGKGGPARALGGRPKWMQEAVGDEYGEETQQGGFRDDDVVFDAHDEGASSEPKDVRPARVVPPKHREADVDLFSDAPAAPLAQTQASSAPSSTRTAPSQGRPAPNRQQSTASSSRATPIPPPNLPPPERTLAIASSAALASALKHKTTGTEQFKLGQYAAAADAYGSAIQALPRGHLLLVPLYTNRAAARIKCGEYKSAEDDCTQALSIVFGDNAASSVDDFGLEAKAGEERKALVWSPSALPPSLLPSATQTAQSAWADPHGRGVDFADGYVKALRRRGQALEGREKWVDAARDWEVLAGCAWAGESVRKDAARARGRCKGMTGPHSAGDSSNKTTTTTTSIRPKQTPPATKPKPRPAPTSTAPGVPSEALRALQSQNARAEADDALKHSLKDSVDARLAAWRQGREGNVRALLVGLDGVLWDGALEGVRVRGLHELVSAAQVKKGYMGTIGRVHPDKLNSSNSSVEQRMLANGVFGTLNEAWIAFQAMQK